MVIVELILPESQVEIQLQQNEIESEVLVLLWLRFGFFSALRASPEIKVIEKYYHLIKFSPDCFTLTFKTHQSYYFLQILLFNGKGFLN